MMSTATIIPIPHPAMAGALGSTAVPQMANNSRNVRTTSTITTPIFPSPLAGAGVPRPATNTMSLCSFRVTNINPATKAPPSWERMYFTPVSLSIFLHTIIESVTAGFMCPPDTFIVALTTMANTTPCASATVCRSPPIIIDPAPINVNANVPIASHSNLLFKLASLILFTLSYA